MLGIFYFFTRGFVQIEVSFFYTVELLYCHAKETS